MPAPVEHVVQAALNSIQFSHSSGDWSRVSKVRFSPSVRGECFQADNSVDISDCVASELLAEFEAKDGVTVFRKNGTVKFLFANRVVVRFKKGGKNGLGMNCRTAANDDFLNPELPFHDAPRAMKIEMCWKLNALGTACANVVVVARNGAGALWSYSLPGGSQQVFAFPVREGAAEEPGRRSIVRLKEGKGKRKKSDDAS